MLVIIIRTLASNAVYSQAKKWHADSKSHTDSAWCLGHGVQVTPKQHAACCKHDCWKSLETCLYISAKRSGVLPFTAALQHFAVLFRSFTFHSIVSVLVYLLACFCHRTQTGQSRYQRVHLQELI